MKCFNCNATLKAIEVRGVNLAIAEFGEDNVVPMCHHCEEVREQHQSALDYYPLEDGDYEGAILTLQEEYL
ncbi:hypothetical protein NVP1015O_58 [Vibrio phage 1.015.O._10N.222.51.E5]|nr:hypothetical protein NVP1015O_58 [Vibrio phage 1.015.O._10N.222.51.E5]